MKEYEIDEKAIVILYAVSSKGTNEFQHLLNIDNAIGNCASGTRNLKLVQSRLIPKSRSDICIVGTVIEEIAIPYEIQTFITKMNPKKALVKMTDFKKFLILDCFYHRAQDPLAVIIIVHSILLDNA